MVAVTEYSDPCADCLYFTMCFTATSLYKYSIYVSISAAQTALSVERPGADPIAQNLWLAKFNMSYEGTNSTMHAGGWTASVHITSLQK